MTRIRFIALFALICASSISAAMLPSGLDAAGQLQPELPVASTPAGGFAWLRLAAGVQFQRDGVTKSLIFYGPGVVRVSAHRGQSHTHQASLAVVAQPQAVALELSETDEALEIRSPVLRVSVNKRSGALAFHRGDGSLVTRERDDSPADIQPVSIDGEPSYAIRHSFTLTPDESLYGLGQYNEPYMDYRGREVLLVQTNIGAVVPFMVSTRRYGVLWDVYSKATFSDNAEGATFRAESAPAGIDYYLVAGGTMDEVIAGYRQLTGAAPMMPRSAFGLFMSKERYPTQQRLLEVVRRFRAERFPLDTIVQDWQYWGGQKNGEWDGSWSGMTWDSERFPDPAGMVRTLHEELNTQLMVSIWPSIGNDTALAHELDAKGLRFEPLHWISGKARIYDAFSEEGRAIYFKHLKKGLLDIGVDALWMDGTEVEVGGACHDPAQVEADIKRLGRNAMGDFTRYLNPYSLMTTRGAYEGQRASRDQRVFTLTRSAWAGQQRYAAAPWSGDTTASWATLRAQIAGGLNVAMAGLPYWSQDTGGFFVNAPGGERNPGWRELFARWNQFGIFNPIYRIHGTDVEREPYVFKTLDAPVYRSLLRAAELRYRLLPYLYGLGWRSTSEGYTMMRALPMDFPDQAALRKVDDAYMFGPAFLVQPITRPMFHAEAPPAPTVPASQLRTPEGAPGLALEYFDGTNFERSASRTVDTRVEHQWPGPPLAGPPPGLTRLEQFSARWQGELVAAESGEHEIGVEGDDGFRLWLDDKLVVDDWAVGAKRFGSTRLTLRAGQAVRVRIDYYQAGGERALRLAWRPPSEQRALATRKLDPNQATLLPAGTDWYDFWSGRRHRGGASVTRPYAIDEFPLFVRAGSVVPFGPVVQHTGEKLDAPYEIRIYPGADGRFTLYEDDGRSYRYEAGERATVALEWNDATRTLHIGARDGQFPGMTAQRTLNVTLMAAGEGGRAQARSVRYTGAAVELRFGGQQREAVAVAEPVGPARVIVLTDIESDPDDTQSLVRLLLYANDIDIRGMVATTSVHQRQEVHPDSIRRVIDRYAAVVGMLRQHDRRYPPAAELRARVASGQPAYGMTAIGPGLDTEGSNLILRELARPDPRPLWISVWGGANTLAQALQKLSRTRSPEAVAQAIARLRVYTISDQDDTGAWLRRSYPDLYYIVSPGSYANATWGGMFDAVEGIDNSAVSNAWIARNIQQGHGPLGAAYPDVAYGMEGDTPAFLSLIPNGLNVPERPDWGGWGGRYELQVPRREDTDPAGFNGGVAVEAETRPIWSNAVDRYRPYVAAPHGRPVAPAPREFSGNRVTVWRWRDAVQNDFAARMQWSTRPYAQANHPPTVRLMHPLQRVGVAGDWLSLDASASSDPDGDSLSYLWFSYPEAGTWKTPIPVGTENLARWSFRLPEVERPETAHFIVQVTDKGAPPLTRYERVVVTILPRAR